MLCRASDDMLCASQPHLRPGAPQQHCRSAAACVSRQGLVRTRITSSLQVARSFNAMWARVCPDSANSHEIVAGQNSVHNTAGHWGGTSMQLIEQQPLGGSQRWYFAAQSCSAAAWRWLGEAPGRRRFTSSSASSAEEASPAACSSAAAAAALRPWPCRQVGRRRGGTLKCRLVRRFKVQLRARRPLALLLEHWQTR